MNTDSASSRATVHTEPLFDLGELAGPLAHEFNNFLNDLMLRLSVLETKLPDQGGAELSGLRQQAMQMAALVKHWHAFQPDTAPLEPIELNRVVVQTLPSLSGSERITLELSNPSPIVRGTWLDLQRLLELLVTSAVQAVSAERGTVTVRTRDQADAVLLEVEDSGPVPPLLSAVFEPTQPPRPGTSSLVYAAAARIVRRLRGQIKATHSPGRPFVVTAILEPTRSG
jgi:C4-dicarboxylate-specific signal transduction histidine kinase